MLAGTFAVDLAGHGVVAAGSLAAPLARPVARRRSTAPTCCTCRRSTRAGGLLLGAAAAFVWRPWRIGRRGRRRSLPGLECAGAAALTMLVLAFCSAHLATAATFRGPCRWSRSPRWSSSASSCTLVRRRCAGCSGAGRSSPWAGAATASTCGTGRSSCWCGVAGRRRWRVGLALALTALVSELCYRYVETPIRDGHVAGDVRRAGAAGWRPRSATATMIVALPGAAGRRRCRPLLGVRPFDRAAGGTETAVRRRAACRGPGRRGPAAAGAVPAERSPSSATAWPTPS